MTLSFSEEASVLYFAELEVGRRCVRRVRGHGQNRRMTDEFDVKSGRSLNICNVTIGWALKLLAMDETSIAIAAAR